MRAQVTLTIALAVNCLAWAQTPAQPPQVTFVDPVPQLLSGAQVTTNVNALAAKGRVVEGVGADGATEMVLRIPADGVGEQFRLTVINDQGMHSSSAAEDGGLGGIGTTSFSASQITITAVNTSSGPFAFAVYGVPVDFPRPEGQDENSAERFISINALALDTQLSSSPSVTILRPPLVLIHGLWGSSSDWNDFTPLIDDPRFAISRANYGNIIGPQIKSYKPSLPSWARPSVQLAPASALGFAYNAPNVLKQISTFLGEFKTGTNPANAAVAAVQVDIVAHSMGGDITRTMPAVKGFYANSTYTLGPIQKVITIATPHWGSPLAIKLVDKNDTCVRGVLALSSSPSFTSVTFENGSVFTGGVGDLEGDGFDGSLSAALKALQNPIAHPLPTALIQGLESQSQLDGLNTSAVAESIRLLCIGDYLADHLTAKGWPEIFNQESDSIVPALSAVAGLTPSSVVQGVIHSQSSELLGFGPPAELDAAGNIPAVVTDLLNTPVTNSTYIPLPQP